jgi:hypothetical protein
MALVLGPGFSQCVLRFKCAGDAEEAVTTIGIANGTVPGGANNSASFVRDAWLASFAVAGQSSSYTFVGVTAYVGQDGGPPVVVEALSGRVGTNATGPIPINCATLVRKQTALGGRTNRGRMFVPPYDWDEASIDGAGNINPGSVAVVQAKYSAFKAAIGTAVLLHDSSSPGDHVPTVISALVLDSKIATQRRRLRR